MGQQLDRLRFGIEIGFGIEFGIGIKVSLLSVMDYNTKWHLTTKIYLANASPETFTEITIAKVAYLEETS